MGDLRRIEPREPSLPSPEARSEGQPGRVPTKQASWGAPGLPIRARPHSRPGTKAPLARGSGALRLELGMGSVPEALRGREEVVLGCRPSPDLEPSEAAEPKAGLVEGELEVRLSGSLPQPGPGTRKLPRL